jgi:purine-cytosine permease-like protein
MREVLEYPIAEAGPLGIESRGIDYIPASERWAQPRNLFWMWSGALFNVEYLVYGAVLFGFGFTLLQAISIILIANLSYILLSLTSLQGPEAGTTTFTINRAAFGPNGSRLLALFNWLTQVGFETEGVAIIVLAAIALTQKAGVHSPGAGYKIVFLLLAGAIQLVLPLLGHHKILKTLRVLFWPFLALFIVFAALTVSKVKLHSVAHGASWQVYFEGLAFIISASGLGWAENGNDFSRYLPRTFSKTKTVVAIFLGTYIPSVLLMTLGAAVATFVGSQNASITGLSSAFSGWFLWPYLIVAILQLFAINSLDLYSSGVTLQALGLRLKRWQAVVLDTVICTTLAGYAIFASSFNNLLNEFILFIIVWVAPWTAIYLVDWALRKFRYSASDLQKTRSGLYYRSGGIHWPGIIAQILGMIASLMALDAYPHYVSPISNATNGADFSIFTGLLVGGVVYYLLARRSVQAEAALQQEPNEQEILAV